MRTPPHSSTPLRHSKSSEDARAASNPTGALPSLTPPPPPGPFPPSGHNGIHDLSTPHELTTSFAVSREYLESLILWCMCMGHYARSLEHRQELQRHISLYDGADIVPLSADHSVNIHEDSSS